MKRMLASLLIGTVGSFAQAMPSYWAAIETSAYDKAGASGAGDTASYAGYYCTAEQATALFGGSSASAIESYLRNNFDSARASATLYDSVAYSDGEYHILDYTAAPFATAAYVAIAFYGNEAFRVYGHDGSTGGSAVLTPNGQLVFNEELAAAGTVGEWQTVPEPTGATLTLLALAGLALKRKRQC